MALTKLNNLSILWGLIIVSSACYARPLYNFVLSLIPRVYIVYLLGFLTFSGVAFAVLKFNSLPLKQPLEYLKMIIPVSVIGVLFFTLALPEEKIHILLFASLGALKTLEKPYCSFWKITIFVLLFSLISEGFQALLPDRVADYRDLGIDTLSGLMGGIAASVIYRR